MFIFCLFLEVSRYCKYILCFDLIGQLYLMKSLNNMFLYYDAVKTKKFWWNWHETRSVWFGMPRVCKWTFCDGQDGQIIVETRPIILFFLRKINFFSLFSQTFSRFEKETKKIRNETKRKNLRNKTKRNEKK
jgi:hypothetical protein